VQASEPRELRLEGGALWLSVALLLGALAGAFFLGRWTAPEGAPARSESGAGVAPDAVRPAADVDASAGGFDTGGVAEPNRQVAEPAAPAAPGGPWNVQVFAGRDRQAAERLVTTLQGAGWPVKLQSVAEGSGSLVKVRVGGFPTRQAAEEAAGRLRGQGQSGAWVTDTP
jgi:cell division septation protein DedD